MQHSRTTGTTTTQEGARTNGRSASSPCEQPLREAAGEAVIIVNKAVITEAQLADEVVRHQSESDPMMSAGHELVLRELLRQKACELGIACDTPESTADAVLEREVSSPRADTAACLRFYEQHPDQFREGDRVDVSHILFQLTPRVDVMRLRARAGEILNDLLAAGAASFADFARRYSNCLSGRQGGALGIIERGDTVPEFERAVFDLPAHTLVDRLIETRHGFHIVKTGAVVQGHLAAFDTVQARIAAWLEQTSRRRAVHQYLDQLVGQAHITGIPMRGAETPLTQ
jgi:peptidyl-prolyl cis-trans isomerase C